MKYTNVVDQPKKIDMFPDESKYFIVGRCFDGSRHYSEDMTYENALATMPKYVAMVGLFGGGSVDLMTEGAVLRHKKVYTWQ